MPESSPKQLYDEQFNRFMSEIAGSELADDSTTTEFKNFKLFSEITVPAAAEPDPIPEPTTVQGRILRGISRVWDNETTRVLIKAGGAFAGVATVAYATIHKDHVLERQAYQQAQQTRIS